MPARKKRLFCLFSLLAVLLLTVAFRDANERPNQFKISKIPQHIEHNAMLEVSTHIRQTPRPKETFDFPIEVGQHGPVQSLYSGSLQYPFYCMTWESGLGQPLIDNHQGIGVPVYQFDDHGQLSDHIAGYSQDCQINTRIDYFYIDHNGKHQPYTANTNPDDIEQLTIKQKQVPFIIRTERGTINRFIYVIAMLVGEQSNHQLQNTSYWNQKLIYQFGGGSGIGFRQGKLPLHKILERRQDQLKQGYAVIGSTGNITSYTYNMLLAEDTAVRVKRQFEARYGKPQYTIGVGGSGGAIQSYLLAQNHPTLLDGIIPQYSYPDMVSQTIYALDCDLIEHYFAIVDSDNPRWQNWPERQAIVGLNHLNGFAQKYPWLVMLNQSLAGVFPHRPKGSSECINGWFGLSSLINNPRMSYLKPYFDDTLLAQVHWSYWQDMVQIYGRDDDGFARTTWDNEGVQYGLKALQEKRISIAEFINLNRHVGAWKAQKDMQTERFFFAFSHDFPVWTSMWSRHNITQNDPKPATRHKASTAAIAQAYRYGQIFIGNLDVPVIDVRHYLEEQLDMHHASASFASRLRMKQYGREQAQLIWMSRKDYDYTNAAFAAMDRWLENISRTPQRGVVANKPAELEDQCADENGRLLAKGPQVWDGQYNDKPAGECTKLHPIYTTSRIQAGDNWAASTFKCTLQPVAQAMEKGLYGAHDEPQLLAELEAIFPTGVCDYSAPDLGRPSDL